MLKPMQIAPDECFFYYHIKGVDGYRRKVFVDYMHYSKDAEYQRGKK